MARAAAPRPETPEEPAPEGAVALGLTPGGRLFARAAAPDERGLAGPAARRVAAAFGRSPGEGLLHLATTEAASELPPDLAHARELGRLFLTRLRTTQAARQEAGAGGPTGADALAVPPPPEGLGAWVEGAPPFLGAEYLTADVARALWAAVEAALAADVARRGGSLEAWVEAQGGGLALVGRVCLHLAENPGDPAAPFAFLATYTTRVSSAGKPQHAPLGRALQEYAGKKDRQALLALLRPVERAAAASPLARELLESGALYEPRRWSAREAHRFLQEVPALEQAGLVVRVPDWWRARRGPRPEVRVSIGERPGPTLGQDALLDFRVDLVLADEPLTPAEWEALRASAGGLVRLRGQWVEVDPARLQEVLGHWRALERGARQGLSVQESMRLLAGVALGAEAAAAPPEATADWSRVAAGAGLRRVLAELTDPAARAVERVPGLQATLRPYQRDGVSWLALLARLGLGACLADDMGLGKTLQVLALLLLRRELPGRRPSLLVVPASLLGNWKAEAARFAPGLRLLVAHPSERGAAARAAPGGEAQAATSPGARAPRRRRAPGAVPGEPAAPAPVRTSADLTPDDLARADLVVTTYGQVQRLPWATTTAWDLVILDEAQAIKNPGAKQTRAVKGLAGRARVALTGTPVENRLGDLWSIFDFLCPGLLGSARAFQAFSKRLAASADPGRYAPLRRLVGPYLLRRLKSDRSVIADLPDKTELRAYCALTRPQAALYAETVDALARDLERARAEGDMARRGLVLAYLLRFKQVCNHPAQALGVGEWDPGQSGKLARLGQLCEEVAARQEKALVFTQFREAAEPLARFLAGVFGRPGLVLTGQTRVADRRALVERFQDERGPPFFVLSLKAGGTGLNLTAASHVVHFDRWWNPAVEDQATDRAYRIGQRRNVLVHKLVCRGTLEERIDELVEAKRALAGAVVEGEGEVALTELDDEALLRTVALDLGAALAEA